MNQATKSYLESTKPASDHDHHRDPYRSRQVIIIMSITGARFSTLERSETRLSDTPKRTQPGDLQRSL